MYISLKETNKKTKGIKKIIKPLIKFKVYQNNKKYLKKQNIKYNDLLTNINNHNLDNNQRKAILIEEDTTLLLAPAGSGKTQTILGRVLYLLNRKINPRDILVISFTNEACNELKKRINNNKIKVLTFHKLGRSILLNNGYPVELVEKNTIEKIIKENINKININEIMPNHKNHQKDQKELEKLIYRIINLLKGNNYNLQKINEIEEKLEDYKELIKLIKKIYIEYQKHLKIKKQIDFHDMINKSIECVNTYNIYPYKYIIIDEYQDISLIKCELIQIIKQKTNAQLLAVGDDFQSIYQFTGSNIDTIINFNKYFPYSKTLTLKQTYRNSQQLINIATKFIIKNPSQIYKIIYSKKQNKNPIHIYYYKKSYIPILNKLLKQIKEDILILGRNNKDLKHQNFMTIHKSKGKEATNVIIVNLTNKTNGFPNKIQNHEIINYILSDKEKFPLAEERRLFYVALTRTKKNCYLLVDKENPSSFVEEIKKDNHIIEHNK